MDIILGSAYIYIPLQKLSTISIRNATHRLLKKIGYKGQTYDQLINQLLDLKSDKITADDGDLRLKPLGPPRS